MSGSDCGGQITLADINNDGFDDFMAASYYFPGEAL